MQKVETTANKWYNNYISVSYILLKGGYFMEKQRLKNDIFIYAKFILEGEDEKTYEFLNYIGKKLPMYFDEKDLADVVFELLNDLSKEPGKFHWLKEKDKLQITKLFWKIRDLLKIKAPKEIQVIYRQPFLENYIRLLEERKKS